eukprot:425576-Pyramimonas_sp.AAC.1
MKFLHFASSQESSITGISTVMAHVARLADSCSRAALHFGWCVSAAGRWELTRSTAHYPWLWSAIFHVALLAGVRRCLGARIGRGMRCLQQLPEMPSIPQCVISPSSSAVPAWIGDESCAQTNGQRRTGGRYLSCSCSSDHAAAMATKIRWKYQQIWDLIQRHRRFHNNNEYLKYHQQFLRQRKTMGEPRHESESMTANVMVTERA